MKWPQFKNQVDEKLGDYDPEILYIDVDDGYISRHGMVVTESTPDVRSKV